MADIFIVGVPAPDRADLEALAAELGVAGNLVEQRYFDGDIFAEIVLSASMSAAAWATLRTWIRARAEVLKATRVSSRGIEITGYTRADAERLIKACDDVSPDDDGTS